jgi:hypothetical protein
VGSQEGGRGLVGCSISLTRPFVSFTAMVKEKENRLVKTINLDRVLIMSG